MDIIKSVYHDNGCSYIQSIFFIDNLFETFYCITNKKRNISENHIIFKIKNIFIKKLASDKRYTERHSSLLPIALEFFYCITNKKRNIY